MDDAFVAQPCPSSLALGLQCHDHAGHAAQSPTDAWLLACVDPEQLEIRDVPNEDARLLGGR